MQEQMNCMNDSGDFRDVESKCSGRLSHVSSQLEMIPSSRALLSRDKRLPLDMESIWITRKRFLKSIFYVSEFNLATCKETAKQSLKQEGWRQVTQMTTDKNQGTIPMPTFAPRPLTASSTTLVELPQNHMVGQQIGAAIRQISQYTAIYDLENKIQNTGLKWLWFSIGGHVVDQRSGDGRVIGWI